MKNDLQRSSNIWPRVFVCVVLVALIWIVFGQTLTHDFVNYDDKTYVYGNSLISAGLSADGLMETFVDTRTNNWHPLTLISHMIDCQWYGLQPGGHHFTNVLLHSLAAVLLFLVLRQITSVKGQSNAGAARTSDWRSAFVAAVFAIHPLRVESVAWIAERKDVLSGIFFFLTLLAYARYVRERSIGRYLTMSILFACALMSKPMVVTLPVVLILLDYWPFNRISDLKSVWRVTLEKLPLFGLSLASSIVTFLLQERSTGSIAQLPFSWRLENALVSYVTYIFQIFWPTNLTVFYPHPEDTLPLWQIAGAAALLVAITWISFVLRRSRPYLLVGWLWYLVMLLPVIGIVEVGLQGHADRYTYLPHVGLYIALTWLIADLLKTSNAEWSAWDARHRRQSDEGRSERARAASEFQRRTPSIEQKTLNSTLGARCWALGVCCLVTVIALAIAARAQVSYWRDSETLWTRALAVTKDNDVAHTNYGILLMDRGQLDEALSHLQTALSIRSASSHAHYTLSLALIHGAIGNVLERKGQLGDAIAELRESSRLQPAYSDAHYNLGTALFEEGDIDGAIAEWRTTLSIRPDDVGAQTSLGNALVQKGELREATEHYKAALEAAPDSVLPLNNLAWIFSTSPDGTLRNAARAVELAKEANRLSQNNNPIFVRTLAAAFAEIGQFENAISTAESAARLANSQGQPALAQQIMDDVDLYRRQQPVRDQSLTNARTNR